MQSLKINLYLIIVVTACASFLVSCGNNEEEHAAEESHQELPSDMVALTPFQVQAAGIRLGDFEQKNLSNLLKASGKLDLPPQNKAGVSSLIGGKITKINVVQGDKVKKGQVLALIENPQIVQMQKDYLEAKSQFGYAEQEYLRQKELYEQKIVAGKKYQAAMADYQAKKALVTSLESQLRQISISPASVASGSFSNTIPVTTPIDGYVNTISVKTGSYIDPTQEIFMVVDNDHIHADLQVFEKDITKVKQGQKIFFKIRGSDSIYIASIFAVGKAFDENTRSVSIHAEIEDDKNHILLPGMYIDGRIQIGQGTVNALPDEAIVKEGNRNYIFVKLDSVPESLHRDDHDQIEGGSEEHQDEGEEEIFYRKIQIKTGVSDLGYTEVTPLEKIPANAPVVIKGGYVLSGQMQNEQGGGGDSHGH